jgi:hypothetical protein
MSNIDADNDTFEAWREKVHDDLVLAVRLACWYAEYHGTTGEPQHPETKPHPLNALAGKGLI